MVGLCLLVHRFQPILAHTAVLPSDYWRHSRSRLSRDARESSVCINVVSWEEGLHDYRWLVDVDRDDEGFQVLVDLHGGDPEDLIAKAEYQEIKDRVMFEVSF